MTTQITVLHNMRCERDRFELSAGDLKHIEKAMLNQVEITEDYDGGGSHTPNIDMMEVGEYVYLREDFDVLEEKYHHTCEHLTQANAIIQDHEQQLEEMQTAYQIELRAMQARIKHLNEELELQYQENRRTERKVRAAQETAFRNLREAAEWPALEDEIIRRELKTLEGRLRSWAREYAHTDASIFQRLSPKWLSFIAGELKIVTRLGTDFAQVIKGQKWNDKAPFLFTHAITSSYVFHEYFRRPFHVVKSAFGPEDGSQATASAVAGMLHNMYKDFQDVDTKRAYFWRSDTLRLLSSSEQIMEDEGWGREATSKQLAASTIQSVYPMLRRLGKDEEKERHELLSSIFMAVSKLCTRIWTQRTHMRCFWLKDLDAFSVDSPYMTAHRLHHIDEGDRRLDGKKILAVIQPAIVAFGTSEGENYEAERLWLPAIVLIDEPEEIDNSSRLKEDRAKYNSLGFGLGIFKWPFK